MPSHIVVNSLGLTYKGTIGISIATIPDVCKTPTPGGPVPLPYPNFANQGTLKDGTTTVFAKGGKMIAIKGSQYGMSTGDEPGTVGGVKSNVFKKATDWITYSFDVKMDGKNACRHTDKKFHNDKNTVDLGGNLDPSTWTDDDGNLCLDCANASYDGEELSKCQKEEICGKIANYDDAVKGKGSRTVKKAGKAYKANRTAGNNACKSINRYARDDRGAGGVGKPEDMGFHPMSKKCAEETLADAKANDFKGYSPDHMIEIQHNGLPTSTSNLVWMSQGANEWTGTCMRQLKTSGPNKHTGVKGTCCKGDQKC
ncbi:DUF4150 domain-containing protein [Mesorhizobium sp. M1396]|uniref:DUF4150 domain-containing protein n=1 Tax=Mesorhizobium sp. M1396 TaxID=2957095 RepID=UPI0033360597